MTLDTTAVDGDHHGPPVAPVRAHDASDAPEVIVVRSVVEHGDQRGRQIGFPTANLSLEHERVDDGVWAGWLERNDGARHPAAVSVGRRPTVYRHGVRLLEAHVIDFAGDLYDELVTVWLVQHLREQQRFDGLDALVRQLRQDVESARQWCSSTCWTPPFDARTSIPSGGCLLLPG